METGGWPSTATVREKQSSDSLTNDEYFIYFIFGCIRS